MILQTSSRYSSAVHEVARTLRSSTSDESAAGRSAADALAASLKRRTTRATSRPLCGVSAVYRLDLLDPTHETVKTRDAAKYLVSFYSFQTVCNSVATADLTATCVHPASRSAASLAASAARVADWSSAADLASAATRKTSRSCLLWHEYHESGRNEGNVSIQIRRVHL